MTRECKNASTSNLSGIDRSGLLRRWLRGRRLASLIAAVGLTAFLTRSFWALPLLWSLVTQSARTQDFEAAHAWLNRSAWCFSDSAEVCLLRARVFRREGKQDAFRSELKKAVQFGLSPTRANREQYLAQAQIGQLRDAAPHLPAMLKSPQGDEREICEAFVIGFLRNRRYAEAMALIEAWATDLPGDPFPWLYQGHLYASLSRNAQAEAAYRAAMERNSAMPDAALQLATLLCNSNQLTDALPYLVIAEKSVRHRQAALGAHSRALRMLGEYESARKIAAGIDLTSSGEFDAQLEFAQIETETGNYAVARKVLEKLVKDRPWKRESRSLLARCQNAAGDEVTARRNLDQAVAIDAARQRLMVLGDLLANDPMDVDMRLEAGLLCVKYGSPEEAVTWLSGVLDLQPEHQAAHAALAEFYRTCTEQTAETRRLASYHTKKAGNLPARDSLPEI